MEETYLAAIGRAQKELLEEDDSVVLLGEDLLTNVFGTAPGFLEKFGPDRIRNTPLSEEGFIGMAAGAAMTGLRPIIDVTFATFMYLGFDQIINQVAKNRYMFGGQVSIPVTYRASMFYGASMAAHHSDRPYSMLMSVPGLTVVLPSSPTDAYGLLKSAVRSNDPVIILEDATLWYKKEQVPEGDTPLGVANVIQEGDDITVVALAGSVSPAREACEELASDGVSVELIDPRTLVPLDAQAIVDSARRTGRLLVVEPGPLTGGAGGEIVALACEHAFADLLAPPQRLAAPDIPIPFSPSMEKSLYPDRPQIVRSVHDLLQTKSRS